MALETVLVTLMEETSILFWGQPISRKQDVAVQTCGDHQWDMYETCQKYWGKQCGLAVAYKGFSPSLVMTELAVPKPHFTERFCITADMMEFHAMQTQWNGILDDILSYIFCENIHIYSFTHAPPKTQAHFQ